MLIKDRPLSHHRLHDFLLSNRNGLHPNLLLPIKIEAKHIPLLLPEILQILHKLPFPSLIVLVPTPDLHLHHELLAPIIHHHIRPPRIPGLGFQVIISCAVNNGLQVQQEELQPILFDEFLIIITINFLKIFHELFQHSIHIKPAVLDKLIHIALSTFEYITLNRFLRHKQVQ